MASSERVQQFLAMRDAYAPNLQPLQVAEPVPVSAGDPVGGAVARGGGGGFARSSAGGLVDFMGRKVSARTAQMHAALAKRYPGLRLTSGYRDPQQNARAGGVKNSHHLRGDATDWGGSAKDMYDAKAWAEQNGAREVLVHNVGSGQHLHVAY